MKSPIFILFLFIYCSQLYSQVNVDNYNNSKLWISLKEPLDAISVGQLVEHFKLSNNQNTYLTNNIKSLKKVFKTDDSILNTIYEIDCYNKNDVFNILKSYPQYIEYIEPVPEIYFDFTPNDYITSGSILWHIDHLKLRQAWDITHNNGIKIKVGINDSGFDGDHEDLIGNIAYIESGADNNEHHGTAVAGIVGMVNNNGIGYCSVAGENILLYLYTYGDPDDIREAADLGVRVINMSWHFCTYSTTYANALNYAESKGVLLIASAGNCSCSGNCTTIQYPSGYDNVIGVAALNNLDIKLSNSSYGDFVTLCAPGENITATEKDNTYYHTACCTSSSTPIVSGVAALILSVNQNYIADEVEFILCNTADPIDHLDGNKSFQGLLGAGRVNANEAVKKAASLHLQNVSISGTKTYQSNYNIYAGANILNPNNIGSTKILNGANITFDANGDVYLESGFEAELGSYFEIK